MSGVAADVQAGDRDMKCNVVHLVDSDLGGTTA
jgi:hypothetical protein